jgi:hypothetical protein
MVAEYAMHTDLERLELALREFSGPRGDGRIQILPRGSRDGIDYLRITWTADWADYRIKWYFITVNDLWPGKYISFAELVPWSTEWAPRKKAKIVSGYDSVKAAYVNLMNAAMAKY